MPPGFTIIEGRASAETSRPPNSPDVFLVRLAVISGLLASLVFPFAGPLFGLQMYGDGSFFSYSVAIEDAWTFWQNMSGRLFVYFFAYIPSQTYGHLARDPVGAVTLYGFLFFAAQLVGLIATYVLDTSRGRFLFVYACVSTACLCPLVFGFPTETWFSHAVFWPALAAAHSERRGVTPAATVAVLFLALVLTHEGALIFAFAVVLTTALRGIRDVAFRRALYCFVVVAAVWGIVKLALPPDEVMADILWRGAMHVFDPEILTGTLVVLIASTLAGYAALLLVLSMLAIPRAALYAFGAAAVALIVYWAAFDHALHAENRYYLRTALLLATPALGVVAAAHMVCFEGKLGLPLPFLNRMIEAVSNPRAAGAIVGAMALLLLIHVVETAKFVAAWQAYKGAVRGLALGRTSDPSLGDVNFVSAQRIDERLNRVSWVSTTPYLSILIAPGMAISKLVVDPRSGFYWLDCATASTQLGFDSAVPRESRRLLRVYSCLHYNRVIR